MKIGDRVYHAIFGWCKITHPITKDGTTLVDLEADEIEYYAMGKGYVKYHRQPDGRHVLYTPAKQLFKDKESVSSEFNLMKMATNAKLTFWDKANG